MSLLKYKQKRSFDATPEPTGGKAASERLRFVIQKHAASHLHYDFRLEMEGVLKSWAVPKGPSMDPAVKRLAMMVEDHPYDYRTFEGVIPERNYGAGTVIVWDEGYYEPAEGDYSMKADADKNLRHQLYSGKLKIVLHGKKLKGLFAVVKAKGRGENGWLLMKMDDKYATNEDILKKDKSVLSRKTVEQMQAKPTNVYGQVEKKEKAQKTLSAAKVTAPRKTNKPHKAAASTTKEKKVIAKATHPMKVAARTPKASRKQKATTHKALDDASYAPFFKELSPMLATRVDKPFDEPGWIYEVKWDGYRAVAFMNDKQVELKSRNDKSFNEKFYPIYQALQDWGINAIVDGEVVVVKDSGASDFGSLQNWRSEADGQLLYYVFDLLWLEGKDLRHLPLTTRREVLKALSPKEGHIQISDAFEVSGTEFYNAAKEMGLEGMIAKKADSPYVSGERTYHWLKIKADERQEMVIGGYTRNEGSSKLFSSLLVGVYQGKRLVYTGKVGTGFNDKQQREMVKAFEPLITDKAPFDEEPDYNKPSRFNPRPAKASAVWLKPKLVCEVSYAEMTSDGVMRHPSFEGLRTDKKAKDVVREIASNTKHVVEKETVASKALVKPSKKGERKTLLNPTDETQVRPVAEHEIKFTNLSKLYWPEDKVTKRDMLNYYYQVAPYILPYLIDRPQSLNRFPNGIHGKSFYQKDVTGKVPDWVETYLYHSSEEADVDKHFMIPKSEADVLLMAAMGCIELNPWSSRIQKPDHPDWCIIDLDPDTGNTFEQVIQAAQVTKQVLDGAGIVSYCKTSGSTGLHIYIPLGAVYTYEQSKEFARVIVTHVHQQLPKFTSIERPTSRRKGKLYLDFLQNRPKATLAAPYSLRPKPGATVSMPLHWDEVKKGLKMKDFTIHNAMARIKEVGDIFKPVMGKKGIDLSGVK
ncbi:DNA ligase D [Parachryseolinea silvisoli]|uniref:DNA ligase D n=1 Tax=Parachryseolinea silvisoli TaxID=2873601 RepID=UPI002265A887|nr:DNA ligase D [Parachryseolinea silvisoli]MCD9015242.1 DNA ligase D [Parachryseolinea silvisoli]